MPTISHNIIWRALDTLSLWRTWIIRKHDRSQQEHCHRRALISIAERIYPSPDIQLTTFLPTNLYERNSSHVTHWQALTSQKYVLQNQKIPGANLPIPRERLRTQSTLEYRFCSFVIWADLQDRNLISIALHLARDNKDHVFSMFSLILPSFEGLFWVSRNLLSVGLIFDTFYWPPILSHWSFPISNSCVSRL